MEQYIYIYICRNEGAKWKGCRVPGKEGGRGDTGERGLVGEGWVNKVKMV